MEKPADTPLAIVGMACRLPGAENLDEFWSLLIEGRSDLGELPPERFNKELYYHPDKGVRTKSYTALGGVVKQRPFDRQMCPLPQSLIERAHEVHLQLCEVAASACRHAGLDPFNLPNRNVGVYVGHTPPGSMSGELMYTRQISETAQYLRQIDGFNQLTGGQQDAVIREVIQSARSIISPDDPKFMLCANAFHGAALITRGFDLKGPSMSYDAACASSLRALGHAARALQLGQIDMAIVGGASYCHADTLILFSQAQSVSATGSRPFDTDADGLVAAEGYVVVVIKTLQRALADGDNILSIIRGIGISSDGKGKSLWAPREEGQIEAVRRAYGSGMSLADVQYMEMHATSTQVGDATEMRALTTVMQGQLPTGRKLPVGSVKANVGHTLETAGLASLCKTVLAMQHGMMPPQINIRKLNEKIDWDAVPFFVPQEAMQWDPPADGVPRRAAVNAFGIGGLNVHVALEQFSPTASRALVSHKPSSHGGKPADAKASEREPIAIVGMGTIFPGARTIEALLDVLASGEDQKRDVPDEPWTQYVDVDSADERAWRFPIRHAGFNTGFQYDWKKHKVPPKQVESADPMQFMLLDAADQALANAGYHDRPFDRMRTGVIVGTIFGGHFADKLQMGLRLPDFRRTLTGVLSRRGVPAESIEQVADRYEDILLKHMPALIDETGSFTSSTQASRITKTFNLMGGAVAVDGGDTAAFAALSSCIDLLHSGDCDMMMCASGQMSLGVAAFSAMGRNGELTSGHPHAPFDAQADGCVPGVGAGVLLLKRQSDAQRDGDTIHGIIRGLGVSRDASLQRGIREAIEKGLQSAGLEPKQISLVEAASVGVPESDQQEAAAIVGAYGSQPREHALFIGAAAAQFGYLAGASGMASLIKAVSDLNSAHMPKIPTLGRPRAELAGHADIVNLPVDRTPIPGINDDGRLFAGVTSFSQYNTAYHLLLEGMTRVPRQPRPQAEPAQPAAVSSIKTEADAIPSVPGPWRIIRIGGESLSQLVAQASQSASQVVELFETADRHGFSVSDRCRLAIVAESPADLATKLTLAAKQVERPESRPVLAEQGIFYGEISPRRPRVAFMFPGQGSQYDGMLKQLIEEFAPATKAAAEVDEVFGSLNLPLFSDLAWEHGELLGTDIWRTQFALLAADTIMHQAVTAIGLRAERLSGHSFGELAALIAGGAWTFEDAVRATAARCSSIESCRNAGGVMLSTSAPADIVEQLCRQTGGLVSVSHRNAPDQTVAGGDAEAIAQLAGLVGQQGFQSKILDVPAAFHTPLMEDTKRPFRRGLESIEIQPPMIPLLSGVTNRYVAEPAEIRENLVNQMTQPVNYVDLIRRLHAEGATVLVEVGPRQVLTGLHKRTFGKGEAAYVACDHKKRAGIAQLLCARACVEVTGAMDPREQRIAVRSDAEKTAVAKVEPAAASISHAPTIVPAAAPAGHAKSSKAVPSAEILEYDGLTVIRLRGTAYERGVQQGRAQMAEIRAVLRRYADLAGTKWDEVFDVEAAVAQPQRFFGPDELDELKGIADGAGVTHAAVIAHNLRLYLDAGAGGIHFAVSAESNPAGGLLHAANEDLQRGMGVRDCLERNVLVHRPVRGIPSVTFGVAGQIGSLNGINASGLAVSTSALLDVPKATSADIGKLHTVLVKNILESAQDIDSAVEIIRRTHGTAACSLCLSHYKSDRICYVECAGESVTVESSASGVIAANHRRMGDADGRVPPHSHYRLQRLKELLGGDRPAEVSISQAQLALRDRFDLSRGRESDAPTLNTVRRVDNQISIVMQPAEGNLWITGGPLSNGHQNQFSLLNLNELLPQSPTNGQSVGPDKPCAAQSNAPKSAVAAAPVVAQPSSGTISTYVSSEKVIDAGGLARAYAQAADDAASAGQPAVCGRFVMRVLEQPLNSPAGAAFAFSGTALIFGHSAVSEALLWKLQEMGVTAVHIPTSSKAEDIINAVNMFWEMGPAPHLFITSPWDDDARTSLSIEDWNNRRQRGVLLAYLATQRWYQRVADANLLDRASLVAVTRMGGDLGFSSRLRNVESGGLCGLLKGIQMELDISKHVKSFATKIVDADETTTPAELAALVCRELSANDGEIEVGYAGGKRYVVRPVVESVIDLPRNDLTAGAPFVITGGARGVTAVVARELGRRFGVKLHLIGSSPLPEIPDAYRHLGDEDLKQLRATIMKDALARGDKPAEAWARFEKTLEIDRTLRSFTESGVAAMYHACDVSDRAALARVLETIRAADGPIQGVIHGAGFERATRFEKKLFELVDRTIAAKVDGAAALMELTRRDPLKYFAAFASVSGRFGGVGQTDYCLANEMLAKLIDWFRQERPDCHSTVFHWHAWDDVGMAVRPESQHIRKLHNIRFMPSLEGAEHLIQELRAGLPETEIVITELSYCRDKFGKVEETHGQPSVGLGGIPDISPFPLIDAIAEYAPGQRLIAEVHLDPTADVFLLQHQFKGRPLMPVVMSMESLCEAAILLSGADHHVHSLRKIELLSGLRFHTDQPQIARLHAVRTDEGIACTLSVDFVNRKGIVLEKDRPYVRCLIETSPKPPVLEIQKPEEPEWWNRVGYPEGEFVIKHGPVFQCMSQIAADPQKGVGRVTAPDLSAVAANRRGGRWTLPAAMLDSGMYASGIHLWFWNKGIVAIPQGVDALKIGRLPRTGEDCRIYLWYRGRDNDLGVYDFTMFAEDGSVILHVEGYRNVIVAETPVYAL